MSKNKKKGNKNKKKTLNIDTKEKRELTFKEDGQEYAQILKMLGNSRCESYCFDGSKRLLHIRGKMRKKIWINNGDIVLVSLRDFQESKGDIILKYSTDESRCLKAYGELPNNIPLNDKPLIEYENQFNNFNENFDKSYEFII